MCVYVCMFKHICHSPLISLAFAFILFDIKEMDRFFQIHHFWGERILRRLKSCSCREVSKFLWHEGHQQPAFNSPLILIFLWWIRGNKIYRDWVDVNMILKNKQKKNSIFTKYAYWSIGSSKLALCRGWGSVSFW